DRLVRPPDRQSRTRVPAARSSPWRSQRRNSTGLQRRVNLEHKNLPVLHSAAYVPRMTTPTRVAGATWYRWDDMEREVLHDKLARRLITGDKMMLTHVYLKKGCHVPKHSHHNEQFTYVLEGALRFLVGDEAQEI